MASKDKVPEKVQAAIFAQLLNNPYNGVCADCHTAAPNWVSLDFGVFICMRCSGVHRQIGPHITRVRSVKLDGWTKENIEIMATVGNKIANDYYEYKMPTGYRRPGNNSSADECRRYIDDKYIHKKFTAPGFPEPVKDFVECRAKGTKPDFSYSQQKQNKEQEAPQPVVKPQQQQHQQQHQQQQQSGQTAFKFIRKKSASLEKVPEHHHHPDLLSPEIDLLGSTEDNQGIHSASPPASKKINFANFKKAQSQPPVPHHQSQPELTHIGWGQEHGGHSHNLQSQTQHQHQQPQENKVDVMKLYSQPPVQGHQNHFMQGMPQNWQYNHGWNNGMNQGYNMGYMGNQQGGYPQNYGGQQGFHGNQNMGYNPYMNYGGNPGAGQGTVQNQLGNNGFVQAQGPNKFF